VGGGKSSLLNALLGDEQFATDVAHGCTRRQEQRRWQQPIDGLNGIDLVDTPGIDEIAASARERLAARVALGADLVLLVIDSDLTRVELDALDPLLRAGKPLLLVLNRSPPTVTSSVRVAVPAVPPKTAMSPAAHAVGAPAPGRVSQLVRALSQSPFPPSAKPVVSLPSQYRGAAWE
jgi:tRNA U34 5-carboxymethylaminomethyl modifying GTPase MnmE/TrmE